MYLPECRVMSKSVTVDWTMTNQPVCHQLGNWSLTCPDWSPVTRSLTGWLVTGYQFYDRLTGNRLPDLWPVDWSAVTRSMTGWMITGYQVYDRLTGHRLPGWLVYHQLTGQWLVIHDGSTGELKFARGVMIVVMSRIVSMHLVKHSWSLPFTQSSSFFLVTCAEI